MNNPPYTFNPLTPRNEEKTTNPFKRENPTYLYVFLGHQDTKISASTLSAKNVLLAFSLVKEKLLLVQTLSLLSKISLKKKMKLDTEALSKELAEKCNKSNL